jgi:oligosaccharide repeat unit polymerase
LSVVVALPFLISHTRALGANASSGSFWKVVRSGYIEENELPGGALGIVNLAPVYIALSYIAVYELTFKPRYRRRLLAFLALAFVFQLLTVARSNIMQFLVGAIAIVAIRRGRLPIRTTMVLAVVFLFLFGLFQFGLGKMESNWNASGNGRVASFVRSCAVYTAGPLVAFDKVIKYPRHVRNTWKVYKPFVRTANKFGAGLPELSQHLDYTSIAPGMITNVYTFYFTYYVDFGLVGVLFAATLFGLVSATVYRMARSNSPLGVVLYALVVYGIVMSAFAESVCLEVQLWLKAALCVIFFYKLLPLTSVRRSPRLRIGAISPA